ncbi:MAG: GNAT family N-acetyltransferase [Clostridia bacterium]|nr:GNAT family N-acetyltransferase [Clostridia bacterium]
MIIRQATIRDYEAAAALEQSVFQLHYENRKDFLRYRTEPLEKERFASMLEGMIYLLAEEDGIILGQAIAYKRGYKDHPVFNDMEWLEIDDISVAPEAQGKGIGKALFEAMKQTALDMGLHHIELTVWAFNEKAKGFYEKMGMRSRIDRMEIEF